MKNTAVLTVAFNKTASLDACLRSLRTTVGCSYDIFVVDNASTEDVQTIVKKYNARYLRLNKNYFASRAMNIGFQQFRLLHNYRNLLILGSDVRVDKHTVAALSRTLDRNPMIGITGPGHYDIRSKQLLSYGITIDRVTSLLRNFTDKTVVSGMNHFHSLYMIKAKVFHRLGGFNHILFPMIYEEPDLGERCRDTGFLIQSTPSARIWHSLDELFSKPSRNNDSERAQRLFNSLPKAYLFFRNRLIYMRLYSNVLQFLLFALFINPAISLWYLRSMSPRYIQFAFIGIMHGLYFAITKNQSQIRAWNRIVLHI